MRRPGVFGGLTRTGSMMNEEAAEVGRALHAVLERLDFVLKSH